jgi:hypothetical protein
MAKSPHDSIPTHERPYRSEAANYFEFACRHYKEFEKHWANFQTANDSWPIAVFHEKESLFFDEGDTTILFSGLFFEALIWDVALIRLGEDAARSNDKKPVMQRWRNVIKALGGADLETEGEAYRLYDRLIFFRNSLAHSKAYELPRTKDGWEFEGNTWDHRRSFAEAVREARKCLNELPAAAFRLTANREFLSHLRIVRIERQQLT